MMVEDPSRTPAQPEPARNGQVAPHNTDAEEALLGSMLLSGDAVRAAIERHVTPGDFYVPAHRHVFDAILGLYDHGVPIDVLTVASELSGRLTDVGGKARLNALKSATPASASAHAYADLIVEAARRRRILYGAGILREAVLADQDPIPAVGALLELVSPPEEAGQHRLGLSNLLDVDLGPVVDGNEPDEEPFWLRRPDGRALLYPGRYHDFHGEPSAGKTWIAYAAIAEVVRSGGSAAILDWEDTPKTAWSRLRALGVSGDQTRNRAAFRYLRPQGRLRDVELRTLAALASDLSLDLLVVDSLAAALARDGADEQSNADVTGWADRVCRPLLALGVTILALDHVSKATKDRVRGGRGAGAKLALVDGASYAVEVVRPFARDRAGQLRIVIDKDRHGAIGPNGHTAALVDFDPQDGGAALDLRIKAPETQTVDAHGRPRHTGYMERVSRVLYELGDADAELPRSKIAEGFRDHGWKVSNSYLVDALATMVAEGFLDHEGEGRTSRYRLLAPYDRATDPLLADPSATDSDDDGPSDAPQEDLADLFDAELERFEAQYELAEDDDPPDL